MKPQLVRLLALSALAVPAGLWTAGCTATATRESTGEYIDDTSITARVKLALVGDERVRARDIEVETFRGTVQLSGFVDNADQKARAGELAVATAGVRRVQNDLIVKIQP
ncbi:MAG TPA: BON domain-containing protein [Opitutaceae bacterium]|nr:BON domain-containing protein [Opitutaceae bacterium]